MGNAEQDVLYEFYFPARESEGKLRNTAPGQLTG